MRVAIYITSWDYEGISINECFLIPGEENEVSLRQRWDDETAIPYEGKNQHGKWKSTKYAKHTISFYEWMQKNFLKIEHFEFES